MGTNGEAGPGARERPAPRWSRSALVAHGIQLIALIYTTTLLALPLLGVSIYWSSASIVVPQGITAALWGIGAASGFFSLLVSYRTLGWLRGSLSALLSLSSLAIASIALVYLAALLSMPPVDIRP